MFHIYFVFSSEYYPKVSSVWWQTFSPT